MENQNEIPTIGTNKIADFDPGDVGRHVECESDREGPNMPGLPN